MATVKVWGQDFSYGHCAGLEAGLILWPLCRSGSKTFSYDHCAGLEAGLFLWPLCRSGGRTYLMATVQVWKQDLFL